MDAPLRLTISLPGLPSLTTALSRYRTDIADWRPFWTQYFAPAFYQNVLQDFVLEGGGSGQSWAPLSTAYAIWKSRQFPGRGILVRSGVLKASLMGPDAPAAVFRATDTSLELGTSVPYGIYHQMGTSRMPQRPPLRLTPAFMETMGRSMQKFVQDAWVRRRAELIEPAAAGG